MILFATIKILLRAIRLSISLLVNAAKWLNLYSAHVKFHYGYLHGNTGRLTMTSYVSTFENVEKKNPPPYHVSCEPLRIF